MYNRKNTSEANATVCMRWMKNLRWSTASGTPYATPKDREKSLTRVGIEPTTSGFNHHVALSTELKARREQAVGVWGQIRSAQAKY